MENTANRPLGELLQLFGILTPLDVEASLRHQTREGGRLGTCLLETGIVDEETLLAVLGSQLGVATVGRSELAEVDPETARLLPARAAILAGAVPLARRERTLVVAMSEPTSCFQVDDLWRVTGLRIEPKLALELRIAEAQERLYGAPSAERLERLRRRIAARAARNAGAATAPTKEPALSGRER
jgi:hypothetical protein